MPDHGPENKKLPNQEQEPERVMRYLGSLPEVIALIREFWNAMPHGNVPNLLPTSIDPGEWREITVGDRTMLFKTPRGWRVTFIPNTGNAFTKEAIAWLKGKGFIS